MSVDIKQLDPSMGAFVEIDHMRADPDVVHLIGMREAMDRWITKLRHEATGQQHPGVKKVMEEIADYMAADRDGISVALTRAAIKDKSGVMHQIRKD
jgi:hypothetical protein